MKAYSLNNILKAKFKTLEFSGAWKEAIGNPELTGSWFIYGPPKNGKTSFALTLAKYLAEFRRVGYNSVEEGLSLSFQKAVERVSMHEIGNRFVLIEREEVEDMVKRLKKHKSPDIFFIDSVQFLELSFHEYKRLKGLFPSKLFIYISHVEGRQPDGYAARKILRDANVIFRVEGFKAFPVGRYGGGIPITISAQKAAEYWGLKTQN